jgi:cell division protein FtsB
VFTIYKYMYSGEYENGTLVDMKRRYKKNTTREYFLAGVLSLLIVGFSISIVGIFRKEQIARNAVRESRLEYESLTKQKDILQKNMDDLETKRGKEATIRQTYGVALPGEDVIVVVPGKEVVPEAPRSLWKRLFDWFGL